MPGAETSCRLGFFRVFSALAVLLLVTLQTGCGGTPQAPVENRRDGEPGSAARAVSTPSRYTVKRGDTLYSIAWRFGLNHRELASSNGIDRPFTIFPGQQLSLDGAALASTASVGSQTAPVRSKPAPAEAKSTPVRKPSAAKPANQTVAKGAPVSQWRWPTSGKVVRSFSGTVHKGIDIAGTSGDAVNATAPGQVVYAGSGIVGYGKLLIVKHNAHYLSAYGHNRRLLVAEGAVVKAGQKIAEKGSSATNSVKLHFEIRRDGKPVNPLSLLPKR